MRSAYAFPENEVLCGKDNLAGAMLSWNGTLVEELSRKFRSGEQLLQNSIATRINKVVRWKFFSWEKSRAEKAPPPQMPFEKNSTYKRQ
jgi:hypothetical protein